MSTVEFEESRRPDCVRFTTRQFVPEASTLGESVERRYLKDDFYVVYSDLAFFGKMEHTRLHSLDLFVAQTLGQLGDPGLALTDERLRELIFQAGQIEGSWGAAVTDHARQLDLVNTVWPKTADTMVKIEPGMSLEELVESSFLANRGWRILPSSQGKSPMLLTTSKGDLGLDLVNLDTLHGKDPYFLAETIRDYHQVSAMGRLAFSISYNLDYHQIPSAELIPEFLREIGKIEEDSRQARQIESMLLFLDYLVWLGGETYNRSIVVFRDKLKNLHTRMSVGRQAVLGGYLEHMSSCLAEPFDVGLKNFRLKNAYNRLLSERSSWDKTEALRFSGEQKQMLVDPARIVFYQPMQEVKMRQERETDQVFSEFVISTLDITNQNQLLEALQKQLPAIYQKFVQLKEWLGADYAGKSLLDRHISTISLDISLNRLSTLSQIQEASEDLGPAYSLRREAFEDVFVDYSRKIRLSNTYLQGVISLLAIKSAQADLEPRRQGYSVDFHSRRISQCKKLAEEVATHFKQAAERKTEQCVDWEEERSLFAELISQLGIPNDEIRKILEKSEGDSGLFNFEFGQLLLHRRGLINRDSPTYQAFLRFLYSV